MLIATKKKIVILGMMSRIPVAGNMWLVIHYMLGFRRLGFDVYYVEAHRRTPAMLMESESDDGSARAVALIERVMKRFDLHDRWAFHALHDDDRCYGLSEQELRDLYGSAELIINLHGSTIPRPEHLATDRLVLVETDPVELEIELHDNNAGTQEFVRSHRALFTWGLNYDHADCQVPMPDGIRFEPTLPPVVCDFWQPHDVPEPPSFSTVGNWRQPWKVVQYQGETYRWSKDEQFHKFLELPRHVDQPIELALGSYTPEDADLLQRHGWKVRPALEFSTDLDAYREYLIHSRGEFTVAKDQNVRLRSGWFSERSAQYLASGRPVITQETGFSNALPTGNGLFGFSTMDEIVHAMDQVNSDYRRHCRAAAELAYEYFNYDVVLTKFLDRLGIESWPPLKSQRPNKPLEGVPIDWTEMRFSKALDLKPVSRWPTTLCDDTQRTVLDSELPKGRPTGARLAGIWQRKLAQLGRAWTGRWNKDRLLTSVVIVTFNNLVYTRLCLESLPIHTGPENMEVIVVDNQSSDGTAEYLQGLAREFPCIQPIFLDANVGFSSAVNVGLRRAQGDVLVLLNNDTIGPPGWLPRLIAHLSDSTVGLAGPVTNRTGNEAQIPTAYRSYGELLQFAQLHATTCARQRFDIRMLAMYCLAMRREVYDTVGPLDEQFGLGLFEDEDYAVRVRAAGFRVVCAEDVFVHHFGQATIGKLAVNQDYGELFHRNKEIWEQKWSTVWKPYARRICSEYNKLVVRYRAAVCEVLAPDDCPVVVSKGDAALLDLDGRTAHHFPQDSAGRYAGHYPEHSTAAIDHLEQLRSQGATHFVVPASAFWWLDHFAKFHDHLTQRYEMRKRCDDVIVFDLRTPDRDHSVVAKFQEESPS